MDFKYIILTYLPWCLSAATIYMAIQTGNKTNFAWLIGIYLQAFWLLWIVVGGQWGFLPMNLILWAIYFRNYFKWKNEAIEVKEEIKEPLVEKPKRIYKESDFTATSLQIACIMGTNGTPSQQEEAREFLKHFLLIKRI